MNFTNITDFGNIYNHLSNIKINMLMIIIPIAFILIFIFISKSIPKSTIRYSIILSYIIVGVILCLSSEILSLFNKINFTSILLLWLSIIIIFLTICLKNKYFSSLDFKFDNKLSLNEIFPLIFISITIFLLFIISITAPPNNWDSMTYHMSRVSHWIQNQSLKIYPSSSLRQLTYNPCTEFFIMHFQILSNSDKFANLVQWLFYVGNIIAVSAVAKMLCANRKGQIISSLFTATIPMVILQASNTKNDIVVSFWLICFIYFVLRILSDLNWMDSIFGGISLGLAFLTKGTAYIYAFPFCVWLFLSGFQKSGFKFLKYFIIISLFALLVNSGFFYRNYLFQNAILPKESSSVKIKKKDIGFKSFISNITRNSVLHLSTSIKPLNKLIEKSIYTFHDKLNIDIKDANTTFAGHELTVAPSKHEDSAGNFFHFILICVSIVLFIFPKPKQLSHIKYFLAAVSSVILFSLLLKWQPWHSRLHSPLFILFSPFVAIVLNDLKVKKLYLIITFLLIFYSIPFILKNNSRRLISSKWTIFNKPRVEQYFANRQELYESYFDAVNFVKQTQCSQIGLLIGDDSWEYPFWALLKLPNDKNIRIEHVDVNYKSSEGNCGYPIGSFNPCVLMEEDPNKKGIVDLTIQNRSFVKTKKFNEISVFELAE